MSMMDMAVSGNVWRNCWSCVGPNLLFLKIYEVEGSVDRLKRRRQHTMESTEGEKLRMMCDFIGVELRLA